LSKERRVADRAVRDGSNYFFAGGARKEASRHRGGLAPGAAADSSTPNFTMRSSPAVTTLARTITLPSETIMGKSVLLLAATSIALSGAALTAQEFPPSCTMCSATYIPAEEIQEFAHRGRLEEPGGVAEHSLVTEIYYVISGAGINVTGPDLINSVPRPPTNRAVQTLNGPGHNAEAIRDGQTVELKAGDVLVIPAGTGHQFTRIDDHITYLMIRVDPDKVVPLLDASGAREYLDAR
jgi:mannose-6-phosphate isomerase-like protein (cupin superfamily)